MIMEFKVHESKKEDTLEDTARSALAQINRMQYARILVEKGIPQKQIYCYGFAFEGKRVLIARK